MELPHPHRDLNTEKVVQTHIFGMEWLQKAQDGLANRVFTLYLDTNEVVGRAVYISVMNPGRWHPIMSLPTIPYLGVSIDCSFSIIFQNVEIYSY